EILGATGRLRNVEGRLGARRQSSRHRAKEREGKPPSLRQAVIDCARATVRHGDARAHFFVPFLRRALQRRAPFATARVTCTRDPRSKVKTRRRTGSGRSMTTWRYYFRAATCCPSFSAGLDTGRRGGHRCRTRRPT